jgi:alkanesulfonate monooxygenase SsuD/methylene tetrahydromethanopterin reductase-like flavin-dependent oxidoreductase (luciferase family)
MQFGYFTLSDNHYKNNPRTANQLIADILDEAVYAEEVGLHSAWIGEHHFSTLGVLSCPDLVLAQVAARTKRIRLAPAVTVPPLHHPIRVAEQWATLDLLSGGRVDFAAGRGYDRREYAPLGVSFDDNQSVFEEGMEIVRRLWASPEPLTHRGRHYRLDDVAITPQPAQRPIPAYVASFSKPSIELAARLGCNLIVAPFAAAMTFGGLRQVREVYDEACHRAGNPPGRLMCSYFLHFADTPAEEDGLVPARSATIRNARSPPFLATSRRRRPATAILSRSSTACKKSARPTLARIQCCSAPRRRLSTASRRWRRRASPRSSSTSPSASNRMPRSGTRWRGSPPKSRRISRRKPAPAR